MKICPFCLSTFDSDIKSCPKCGHLMQYDAPAHHLPVGTVLNGRYVVGAAIGEGGFGVTYIGKDSKLDMRVAIKEYYPSGYVNRNSTASTQLTYAVSAQRGDFVEKGKASFLNEARALAKFAGEPGIVEVRDFFEGNNTAYIVMDYIDGQTLKDFIKFNGTLTPDTAIELLTPVMKSLCRIHSYGIIHRDISPDNIMLLPGNHAKLIDFGAARNITVENNKSLSVLLKPGYAPEEQYRSRGEQGPWTDVYALCATLYKCITGKTPDEASQRIFEDELKAPSQLGIKIAPNIERAIMHGLAINKANRTPNVEVLMRELCKEEPKPAPVPKPTPKPDKINNDTESNKLSYEIKQKNYDVSKTELKYGEDDKLTAFNPKSEIFKEEKEKKTYKKFILIPILVTAIIAVICCAVLPPKKNPNAKPITVLDSVAVGDIVNFGTYTQRYFSKNKEDIEWQVLDKEDGKVLLISKYILDFQSYLGGDGTSWRKSELYTWLNQDFYETTFTSDEKKYIMSTNIYNSNNKIFILSIPDLEKYFSFASDRQCKATNYAISNNPWSKRKTVTYFCLSDADGSFASFVHTNGDFGYNYHDPDFSFPSPNGVRPAMWVSIDPSNNTSSIDKSSDKKDSSYETPSEKFDYSDTYHNINWGIVESTGTLVLWGSGDIPHEEPPEGVSSWTSGEYYPWRKYKDIVNSIEIKNGIETIHGSVFRDFPITSVHIPKSVEEIDGAFLGCTNLTTVTIESGSNLKIIGCRAFSGTGITKIDLPEGVSKIEYNAFAYTPLESITIPSTVIMIEENIFEDSSIETIYVKEYTSAPRSWDPDWNSNCSANVVWGV